MIKFSKQFSLFKWTYFAISLNVVWLQTNLYLWHIQISELDSLYLCFSGWLDDIGLPQYKDSFMEARIDGRMLHNMTMEDLIGLKITNALHHLSLKSAIHILRRNNFNAMCLIRRPTPDEVRPVFLICGYIVILH